jgi:hypothetical protein
MQSAMRPRQVARVASLVVWALALIWGLTDVLPGYAQDVPIVPYLSTGYRYRVVPQGGGPTGFDQPGFNDSIWAMGDAAFGSQSGAVLGPRPWV